MTDKSINYKFIPALSLVASGMNLPSWSAPVSF